MSLSVEELYTQTRNHPVCHYLIPLESVLSFPIPLLRSGQIYLAFFVYRRGVRPKGKARPVFRPYAHLSIEYPSGRLVEYVDMCFAEGTPISPLSDEIGTYPHDAVSDLGFQEMLSLRSALFEATEALIPLYSEAGEVVNSNRERLSEYRRLFELLIEPSLQPFYRSLNPDFFEWLSVRA